MVIGLFQLLIAALTVAWLKIFTKVEIEGQNHLAEVTKPLIVAANHEAHLDPQLVAIALLAKPKLFPLRYMAKDVFFRIPLFNFLIWLMGGFPAKKGKGIERSLALPLSILKRGGSVIIFPEGRMVIERPALGEGRRGAAMLGLKTGAMILPISLHSPRDLPPLPIIWGRPKITVRIGQPFRLDRTKLLPAEDRAVLEATKLIMQKIADLYYQHRY